MCIVIFTHGKFKYILMTSVHRTMQNLGRFALNEQMGGQVLAVNDLFLYKMWNSFFDEVV